MYQVTCYVPRIRFKVTCRTSSSDSEDTRSPKLQLARLRSKSNFFGYKEPSLVCLRRGVLMGRSVIFVHFKLKYAVNKYLVKGSESHCLLSPQKLRKRMDLPKDSGQVANQIISITNLFPHLSISAKFFRICRLLFHFRCLVVLIINFHVVYILGSFN